MRLAAGGHGWMDGKETTALTHVHTSDKRKKKQKLIEILHTGWVL
jgi:hypothetical protein